MDESQWVRFLWQGHHGQVIKSGQDPDRVLATRSFQPGWCYVRECPNHIDLEAMSINTCWNQETGKRTGVVWEWMTCSITMAEYKKLDSILGPRDDGCKHKEGAYDFTIKG